jgi:hypothetical protein
LHVAAFYDGVYYVLGGTNNLATALCGIFYSLTIEDSWKYTPSKNIFTTRFDEGVWTQMSTSFGLCISRPAYHSKVNSPLLYMYGGIDNQGDISSSLTLVDLDEESTETLATTGDFPPASHSGMLSSINSTLVLYGGLSQEEGKSVWLDTLYTLDLGKFIKILTGRNSYLD